MGVQRGTGIFFETMDRTPLSEKYSRPHYPHYPCLPIKYSSGNRKIHTMSTKCQYSPLISIGLAYSAVIVPFQDHHSITVMMPSPMIMCRACNPVMTK